MTWVLQAVDDVSDALVSLAAKQAQVSYDAAKTTQAEPKQAIEDAGYGLQELECSCFVRRAHAAFFIRMKNESHTDDFGGWAGGFATG